MTRSQEQTVDDHELLRRIAAGDTTAVPILFDRHQLRIFRFIMRLIHNEATAEDLTNEVFLEVWRSADRFQGRSAVSTWMLSIAHNKTVSLLRKRSESELDDGLASTIMDDADTPEITVSKKDKSEQIRLCMDRLSSNHREIIDLVYFHEKTIGDISKILGIPEGTVKTRMFHARKKLGELLRSEGIDRGWP